MSEVSILELELQNEKPTVSNPVEAVVINDLAETVQEIKRIVKSNSQYNRYTKSRLMKVSDDELFRLNQLINML